MRSTNPVVMYRICTVEIKASQTFNDVHLKSLQQWNSYSNNKGGMLLYDGEMEFTTKEKIEILNWKHTKIF